MEVGGRPVRPRALLVGRGSTGAEVWFGKVRVEGERGDDGGGQEAGAGAFLRGGGGGGVDAAAAADATGGESGGERRGRRVPAESPFRLLIDIVPPTSGQLRVEVVLHR